MPSARSVECFGHVFIVVFIEVMNERAVKRVGTFFHQSPIIFLDFSLRKYLVHALQSLARAGKNDRTTHGSVNAMHDAQKHVTRFFIFDFDVLFNEFGKGFVARFVALHQHSARFIDRNNVVVFVNYFWLVHNYFS